jgi:hypothetical protein
MAGLPTLSGTAPIEVTQAHEEDGVFFSWNTGACLIKVPEYSKQEAMTLGVRLATGDEQGNAVHPHVWPTRSKAKEQLNASAATRRAGRA